MSASRTELSRWQFDLTWSLFDYHLADLEPADFRWEPSALCWTIRADGTPDWADTEPDPIPVPTIAWLTWHIGWWWSVALDHANGRPPREREEITWPGEDSTIEWLRGLREEWLAVLDRSTDTDLDAPSAYPWGEDAGLTFAHTADWVNSELMKNVAEIGQLRLLRRSSV